MSPGRPAGRAADDIEVVQPERSAAALRLKRLVQLGFSLWVSPRVLAYRLAHAIAGERAFLGASESIAGLSGSWGVYCRQAFYRRTLERCGQDSYFGWQSTFSMRQARVGEGVYVGRRCSIGYAHIGDHVMLADGVQILSGGREHGLRATDGETHQDQAQTYRCVTLGEGAWIGTNAVVMADVGAHSVVGAGAVVTRPVPASSVAAGVPARVIKAVGE